MSTSTKLAPPSESVLESKYELLKPIGKGKFAVVYRARRKEDDELVALKKIAVDSMDHRARDKTLKEVRLLQSLHHPNIIRYLDSLIENDELVIVFEWAAAGDLKRQIRKANERAARFEERVIWKYFSQICDALAHMHEQRILHRDLKPANVFLTLNGTVKVGDLGLGRAMSEHTFEAHSKVGTPLYMSPEVLRGDGYDWKSDIWSLGCILYELAMLRSPFKAEGLNLYSLFQKISKADFEQLPDCFSSDLRDLCNQMLSVDPQHRPDVTEVCEVATRMRRETMSAAAAARAEATSSSSSLVEKAPETSVARPENEPRDASASSSSSQRRASLPASSPRAKSDVPVSPLRKIRPNSEACAKSDGASYEQVYAQQRPAANGKRNAGAVLRRQQEDTGGMQRLAPETTTSNHEAVTRALRERRPGADSGPPLHSLLAASEAAVEILLVLGFALERRAADEPPLLRSHFALDGCGAGVPRARQFGDFACALAFLLAKLLGCGAPALRGLARDCAQGLEAPTRSASRLLAALVCAGFPAERAATATPPQLARGFGGAACDVLTWASEAALSALPFAAPRFEEEACEERCDFDDDARDAGDGDDDIMDECDDFAFDADEAVFREPASFAEASWCDASREGGTARCGSPRGRVSRRCVITSGVDAREWRLELERVASRLRAVSSPLGLEWRGRLELSRACVSKREQDAECLGHAARLGQASLDAVRSVETSEQTLHRRFNDVAESYAARAECCVALAFRCDEARARVALKSEELQQAALEEANAVDALAEKGASISDSSQLRNLRDALIRLKRDTTALDLQVGLALQRTDAQRRNSANERWRGEALSSLRHARHPAPRHHHDPDDQYDDADSL